MTACAAMASGERASSMRRVTGLTAGKARRARGLRLGGALAALGGAESTAGNSSTSRGAASPSSCSSLDHPDHLERVGVAAQAGERHGCADQIEHRLQLVIALLRAMQESR